MRNTLGDLIISLSSPRHGSIAKLEDGIAVMPGVRCCTQASPTRSELMNEGMMPILSRTRAGLLKSLRSLSQNPSHPRTQAPPGFLHELDAFVRALGVSSVGYVKVPERWVFQGKAILHDNAIVMTMEMDKKRIDMAPSPASRRAARKIYRDLGRVANQVAAYLRQQRYSAHAGHPFMGMALYPPLAQMAGLGWLGSSGVIITPEHGPRVRLATVYTSIENLPIGPENGHQWVEEYCTQCQLCIRHCPAEAILEEPIDHGNGQLSHIVSEYCFPYFSGHHGCLVCIKVCPFNQAPYDSIKRQFEQNLA